ncbi:hypothetical protein BN1723_018011 [Verticillium longisporum]|uniref:Uncharacterized protein n=1 Tax=Verticillium longisporum TaxID=100787 RepID=A0A0G4LL80_VERLO|nr:hypothetical protein BN1723_018011 [Verticillium longisporum]
MEPLPSRSACLTISSISSSPRHLRHLVSSSSATVHQRAMASSTLPARVKGRLCSSASTTSTRMVSCEAASMM